MITIIAALDKNGVIGKDNTIPWHYPEDMKWFKEQTMGSIIVMGRKTYESIPKELPGRIPYILSTSNFRPNYGVRFPKKIMIQQWIRYYEEIHKINTFIIGGAQIYKEFLDIADRLLITKINKEFDGDTFFPVSNEELATQYYGKILKKSGDLTFWEFLKSKGDNQ